MPWLSTNQGNGYTHRWTRRRVSTIGRRSRLSRALLCGPVRSAVDVEDSGKGAAMRRSDYIETAVQMTPEKLRALAEEAHQHGIVWDDFGASTGVICAVPVVQNVPGIVSWKTSLARGGITGIFPQLPQHRCERGISPGELTSPWDY